MPPADQPPSNLPAFNPEAPQRLPAEVVGAALRQLQADLAVSPPSEEDLGRRLQKIEEQVALANTRLNRLIGALAALDARMNDLSDSFPTQAGKGPV